MARASAKRSGSGAKAGASKPKSVPPADDPLAGRIRELLGRREFTEQKMFGGICFMLGGNMLAGASKRGLLVRVGKDGHAAAVKRLHARPMEMRGRAMEGYVYVDPPGTKSDKDLGRWIDLAVTHVETLPPKAKARTNMDAASRAKARPK